MRFGVPNKVGIMKKVVFGFLVLASMGVKAKPLPSDFSKNWKGVVSGIEVSVQQLGEYKGLASIEGGQFYQFTKKTRDAWGQTSKCDYYIRKDSKIHYVTHFCD